MRGSISCVILMKGGSMVKITMDAVECNAHHGSLGDCRQNFRSIHSLVVWRTECRTRSLALLW